MLRSASPLPIPVPSSTAVDGLSGATASGPVGAPAAVSAGKTIGIARIQQSMDQWCWAACTLMVLRLRGDETTTQGAIVNVGLGRGDCDGSYPPEACDRPIPIKTSTGKMDVAKVFQRFDISVQFTDGVLSLDALRSQSENDRIVEVVFNWAPNGHVALVHGWECADPAAPVMLHVSDPKFGDRGKVRYEALLSAYGFGRWAVSYTDIH